MSDLRQLVPEAHSPKKLAQMKPATEEVVSGAATMTTRKRIEFQVHQSHAWTAATSCSIADKNRVVNQQEREIYSITSNEPMWFKRKYFFHLIKFEAW